MSTIKNIIIFIVIAAIVILAYVFFFKKAPEEGNLTSTVSSTAAPLAGSGQTSSIGQDFLSVLLNVKSIKLDDSIFSDPAFISLRDSSIILISDGTEGRPNPFAPLGADISGASINALDLNNPDTEEQNPIL